jgi:transposase
MYFSYNIGIRLSLDEVSLSKGELYTFLTNKEGKGKRGSLVTCTKGTLSKDIIQTIKRIPQEQRDLVEEVTIDMAKNMESAVKECFPNAKIVTDRFHVVKLVLDALQHIRIAYRWIAIDAENEAIQEAKKKGEKYVPKYFENEDSPKQLLARSRYILAKKRKDWTPTQVQRAAILFREYPVLERAYNHTLQFRNIYEATTREKGTELLEVWKQKNTELNLTKFNTAANTIEYNKENILNFFDNRSTNASAESFNSKIKLFRANLRGVSDTDFFLFRLSKLFA